MRTAGRSLLFTDLVKFKGEPGLNAAVVEAARRNRTSTPEYLRRVVRERLAAEGVALPALDCGDEPRTPPAAPALARAA